MVIDTSEPITEADREIIDLIGDKAALVAANKCDLPQQADLSELRWEAVRTSALSGEGLTQLEERMVNLALGGKVFVSDALMVHNPRHKSALERAEESLTQALSGIASGTADDFITIDLTAALDALGEITGETVQDDLLETIFSNFCVGK